jgi:hypothetical protein
VSWEIINVRNIADHHSDFKLPEMEEVEKLVAGDYAKLLFAFPRPNRNSPDAERMWVQIMGRHECGHWVGRLSNDPLYAPIKLGEDLEFGPEHVLALMKKDTAVVGKESINWTKGDRNDPENWKSDPQKN